MLFAVSESCSRIAHHSDRGISRDEARYPGAEKFIPERFLDGEGRLTDDDPGEFIFGFGRRRCPGRPSVIRPGNALQPGILIMSRHIHCGCLLVECYGDDVSHA